MASQILPLTIGFTAGILSRQTHVVQLRIDEGPP